jgi:hypothetical protein
MPNPHGGRLVLIAGGCLLSGMALIGLPVDASGPLRYFGGGVLVGLAMLLLIFGLRSF